MFYLDESKAPLFCNRRDRARIKRSSEIVCQDATCVIIVAIAGIAVAAALAFLASPLVTRWMLETGWRLPW